MADDPMTDCTNRKAALDELRKQLEREDVAHTHTIEQRDALHERVDQIADSLGVEEEWSNCSDRGEIALERLATLTTQRDTAIAERDALRKEAQEAQVGWYDSNVEIAKFGAVLAVAHTQRDEARRLHEAALARQMRIAKERDDAVGEVERCRALLPRCSETWLSGSGGHRKYARDCTEPGVWDVGGQYVCDAHKHDKGDADAWQWHREREALVELAGGDAAETVAERVLMASAERDSLRTDLSTTRAALRKTEEERDAYRAGLADLLADAAHSGTLSATACDRARPFEERTDTMSVLDKLQARITSIVTNCCGVTRPETTEESLFRIEQKLQGRIAQVAKLEAHAKQQTAFVAKLEAERAGHHWHQHREKLVGERDAALAELRSHRASALSDGDRAALKWLAGDLRTTLNTENRTNGWCDKAWAALTVLSKLLGTEG
jgi:chromosome segregation ATPase